jgi:hypothetical protein
MNKVDLLQIPTPIFITNPTPNFIIPQNSKIMLLVENKEKAAKNKSNSNKYTIKLKENHDMNLHKEKLLKKEEFDKILENLRKKYYEKIDGLE